MKEKIRVAALLVCAAVFLVSGCLLVRDLIRSGREREANQALAQQVHEIREAVQATNSAASQPVDSSNSQEPPEPVSPYAESGLLRQYDPLWQQNNDLAGWLWIEGTNIDYPVMCTPQRPEYYLRKGFDKSYALSGSLFIGEGGGPDDKHIIVFGHHMKDGAMFGNLDKYKSEDYAREHPIIHLDTLTEEREYEVITAFYSRVYEVGETGVFRYYRLQDLTDPDKFDAYLKQVKAAGLYDIGVEAEVGDRILILSTCSYHTEDGRFAVAARQRVIQEEAEDGA